jgi:ankyrin repeat protein
MTVFHIAAANGNSEILAMLIKNGCDIHARNNVSFVCKKANKHFFYFFKRMDIYSVI